MQVGSLMAHSDLVDEVEPPELQQLVRSLPVTQFVLQVRQSVEVPVIDLWWEWGSSLKVARSCS